MHGGYYAAMHNTLKPSEQYDLIIFDCDGTLADSEPAHNETLSRQLRSVGLSQYTPEYCMQSFMGTALPAILKMIEQQHGITLPDNFLAENIRMTNASLEKHLVLEATTTATLETLQNMGYKMAVGSNGSREIVLEILKVAGFDKFFPPEHVFTFEDVAFPKPAPDLYLHAAEKMGSTPEKSLVIEDTVKGALGGINAKIDTIGYVGLSHRDNQAQRLTETGCLFVMHKMAELAEFLKR